MTTRTSTLLPMLVAGALALGSAVPALAQGAAAPEQQQAPGQLNNYSEAELQSFATAVAKLQDINDKWAPEIQGAQNEQEAETMQQQATQEMVAAVEEEGLTVQKYSEISEAARQDPQLRTRIVQLLNQQPPR